MFKKTDKKAIKSKNVILEYVKRFLELLKDQDFQYLEVKKIYMLK